MTNLRKFWLTFASLVGYVAIMALRPGVDPISLGLGLGFLLTPMAAGNAIEHMSKARMVKQ